GPPTARRKPARVVPRPKGAGPRRRLLGLLVLLCLAFAVVVVRLTSIQVVSPSKYAAVGQSQRLRSIVLPAERGAMFDRNGQELALTLSQQTVWANPHLVTDPAEEARLLAPVLQADEGVLRDRLSRDAGFVYLARKVPDDVAARVRGLHLDGVSFIPEPKRFLPAGSLALPLLGAVGLDNGGLSGLELEYDKALAG